MSTGNAVITEGAGMRALSHSRLNILYSGSSPNPIAPLLSNASNFSILVFLGPDLEIHST